MTGKSKPFSCDFTTTVKAMDSKFKTDKDRDFGSASRFQKKVKKESSSEQSDEDGEFS